MFHSRQNISDFVLKNIPSYAIVSTITFMDMTGCTLSSKYDKTHTGIASTVE